MKTTAIRITVGATLMTLFLLAEPPSITAADTFVEPSPIAQLARGLNPANWRMPQWKMPDFKNLLPGNDEKARIKKKKEGLFDEVTKTASNSWNKTKAVMNPQNLNPIRFLPASARTPSEPESNPGFFRSLFTPRQEDNSGDVTNFLSRPRPGR